LATNEEGFRTIAEFSPVMLWMADATGKSQFLNKKYLQFIGANDDSNLAALWMDALHPSDRKNCLTTFQNAFKAKLTFQMEYQLRRYDGKYRWILT
jgi:PAS domain S-box-containing protein